MELTPVILDGVPLFATTQWRFKKHNVHGLITEDSETGTYKFELKHFSFTESREGYLSIDDAKAAAEKKIDLWYNVQGRLLALK
ncbi:hypothetical protein [Salibacterium aidingense]|uniref:hypothetical protein n=1 Tax=Salibacterium aidingense TaxID=384933 RepID=UPI00054E1C6D|nr:hypothetical protein [Salibacterium aidingense]